ncbi:MULTISPECIES: prolipoprotein diacylglyceryl transferase [unclassified Mesotoga]|uniref:prolipoprotein diacylglyceryl transferase n=1 Tax=unclassified Mesotoga TaxID=1184398 RepID=UPI000DA6439F|nr:MULTISPECIES: prolipoprotein diacylglyceryl transferase [unclassified Mesotoga]PZC52764.1 diacylglyceryl transferase [Mesotoga sp. TolDC]
MKKRVVLISVAAASAVALFFFLRAVFSGELILNPVIVEGLGPFSIRWYGVMIATAIIVAYVLGRHQGLKEGIEEDYMIEAVFIGIIFGVLGARIYYVVFNYEMYRGDFWSIFRTWDGGLAIHGAFFAALLVTSLYVTFRKKANLKFLQATDIFTAVLPLAQAIGRWGNFINYEAYGSPTDLPWKMFVPLRYRMPGYSEFEYFHPTFLYESLANVAIFAVLYWYLGKRKNYGEVTALYMVFYSIVRFFIEGLRLDSLYIGQTDMRTAKAVSVILLITGIVLFIFSRYKGKQAKRAS